MIRRIFNAILPQKSEVPESDYPRFTITENNMQKSDFEVTELSYEEYANYERRRTSKIVVHNRRNTT